MASESKTCLRCRKVVQLQWSEEDPFGAMMVRLWRYCETCLPVALEESESDRRAEEAREREERWARICPKAFVDTDLSDPRLNAHIVSAGRAWRPGAKGLGFMGPSGCGKSRVAYATALKRAYDAGLWIAHISHVQFRRVVLDLFQDGETRLSARNRLDGLRRADVLLLDDLGKAPATEAVDAELLELVDDRTSNGRPLIWTSNGGGAWLIERMGPDRGRPIVRRLAEFCECVNLNPATER